MTQTTLPLPFWKSKKLEELTHTEWESLCDGCGLCCLEKISVEVDPCSQHSETTSKSHVKTTCVSCRLLDGKTGRCSDYDRRFSLVPECIKITPRLARTLSWLPPSCAYRLVAEEKDLPDWHPLLTKNPNSTKQAGFSVVGKTIHPYLVEEEEWEDYIFDLPSLDSPKESEEELFSPYQKRTKKKLRT